MVDSAGSAAQQQHRGTQRAEARVRQGRGYSPLRPQDQVTGISSVLQGHICDPPVEGLAARLAGPLADGLGVEALLVALAVLAQVATGEVLGDEVDALGLGVLPTLVAADDVGVILRGAQTKYSNIQIRPALESDVVPKRNKRLSTSSKKCYISLPHSGIFETQEDQPNQEQPTIGFNALAPA